MTTSTHDHIGFAGTRQAISFIMDSVLAEVTDEDKMEPQFMSLTNTEFFKRVLATKPPFNPGVEGPSQREDCEAELTPPSSPVFPSPPSSPGTPSHSPEDSVSKSPSPVLSPLSMSDISLPIFTLKRSQSASPRLDWNSEVQKRLREDYSFTISGDSAGDLAEDDTDASSGPSVSSNPPSPVLQPLTEAQLESDDEKTVKGKNQDVYSQVPEETPKKIEKPVKAVQCSGVTSDNTEKAGGLTRSSSLVQLLHRPPRLGLSRLQRKVHNLHQIVTSEKEE